MIVLNMIIWEKRSKGFQLVYAELHEGILPRDNLLERLFDKMYDMCIEYGPSGGTEKMLMF